MWEHYVFKEDEAFLRERAYPALKGAAEFVLDWLVEDEQGCLTTNPSTSPENYFRTPEGTASSTSVSSTMDRSIIRVLFRHCLQAAKMLGTDEPFLRRLIAAEAKLHPFAVGRHGQLQEWLEDFEEHEPGHRHWSHLYGLYPGNLFTARETPELLAAARRSIERRLEHGGGEAGWSAAWAVNLWARLGEGARAYLALRAVWNPRLVRNTIALSLLKLVFSFPVPILLAIMINEVRVSVVKRFVQTVSYLLTSFHGLSSSASLTLSSPPSWESSTKPCRPWG